jgi:hypothetical protein
MECWFRSGSNIESLALAYVEVSSSDKRKLGGNLWRDKNSIWGRLSQVVFEKNEATARFFLFNIWDSDVRNFKVSI